MSKRKYFLKRVLSVAVSASMVVSSANIPVMATEAENQTEVIVEESTEAEAAETEASETETSETETSKEETSEIEASEEKATETEADSETETDTETQTATKEAEGETVAETETAKETVAEEETVAETESETVEVVEDEVADNNMVEDEVEAQESEDYINLGDKKANEKVFESIDSNNSNVEFAYDGTSFHATGTRWGQADWWSVQWAVGDIEVTAGDYIVEYDIVSTKNKAVYSKLTRDDGADKDTPIIQANHELIANETVTYSQKATIGSDGKVRVFFNLAGGEVDCEITISNVRVYSAEQTATADDKAKLQSLVDETKTESDYTEDTWAAYETALSNANTVLDDGEATIADVYDALSELQEAIDGLVTKAEADNTISTSTILDFTALESAGNIEFYQNEEWAGFPTGTSKTDGTSVELDCTNFGSAQWGLQYILKNQKFEAGASYDISFDIVSTEDKNIFFKVTDAGLAEKSVDLVKDTKKNVKVSIDELSNDVSGNIFFALGNNNDVATSAKITISDLTITEKSTVATTEDKADLQALVDDEKVENKYTADSWEKYEKALEDAKALLTNEKATIKDVLNEIDTLNSAIKGLKVDGLISIVVSEQEEQLVVGNDIVLTYVADNDAFIFGDDYKLKINGTEKDTTDVVIDEEKLTITIPASFNTAEGVLEIQFEKDDTYSFTPVYQKVYKDTTEDEWTLVWQDEFNGDKLDENKWDYQTGTGAAYVEAGWGNKEEQYYTDSAENTTVGDGKLTITAKKDNKYGTNYTSARLRTVVEEIGEDGKAKVGTPLKIGTYGKIEAKMKLPAGQGVWPAFWMLPHDSEYGTWAASGEIDIMEARGRLTDTVCGTIHYGGTWPNNVHAGKDFYFEEGDSFENYHIYGIEWDPDEIRWYVDGKEYSAISNWYAQAGEDGNYPFPAPFDEEFYILLNLAVGGTFDPSATSVEVDENGVAMDVDYVRWYQRDAETYENWEITGPSVEKDESQEATDLLSQTYEDGNFITDTDFADMTTTPYTTDGSWELARGSWIPLLIPGNGNGKATWSKVQNDGKNYLKVAVEDAGSQTYSSQMLQYLPIVKGYSYEVSYTAYTDDVAQKADVSLKIGGDNDNGWAVYSGNYTDELTTTPTKYTHKFTMTGETDPTARFEFNLATSTGNVYLSDVSVKLTEIKESDGEDDAKKPLSDGNHVYNGGFNVGSDGLLYWHWTNDDSKDVVSVVKENDERVLKATVGETPVEVWQYGMNLLENDDYQMSFDVNTAEAQDIEISFTSADGKDTYTTKTETLKAGANNVSFVFTQPEGKTDENAKVNIKFVKSVTMDNVKLVRTTNNNVDFDAIDIWPLYNGDFFNGKDGWNIWSEGKGYISTNVNAAGQLEAKVAMGEGAQFYHAGIQSADMHLEKGIKYRVKFDYTLPEAKTYTLELAGEQREITLEAGTHTYTSDAFTGAGNSKLTLYLGPKESPEYTLLLDNVEVYIDESSLKIPEGYAKPVSLATSGQYRAGNAATVLFTDNATWEAAEKEYYLNGEKLAADKVSIDTEKNTITVDGSLLPAEGKYTIKVAATGFTDTKAISLTVLSATNWVVNGDFSKGLEGWGTYFQNGCGTAEVNETGEVVVKHNWNEGSDWHIQLYQENIQYEAGDYVLTFDAWSDVARPIGVQLQNGNNIVPGTANTVALSTEKQSFKFVLKNLASNSEVKLDFPMGNVTLGDLVTPNGDGTAHNIYLDNVVLRPATSEDLDNQPASIKTSGAVTLGQAVDVAFDFVNDKWLAANKTVYVNGTAVAADKVTFKEDKTGFTIAGDVFTAVGRYEIYVVAEGFDASNKVSKNIIGTDGELIFDGDLTNAASWGIHNEDAANLSNGAIVDGVYNLDYKSGSYHSEWGCWITWSSQLIKENISINKDGKYVLKFKASTDLKDGRDIIIEYGTEKQKTVHIDQGEAKEYMVELDLVATDAQAIKFLVGPVGANLQLDTTNAEGANTVPHKLTIDDISLKAASGTGEDGKEDEIVKEGLWVKVLTPAEDMVYTGKAINPKIEVYNGSELLKAKKDYTIKYSNNVNAGQGTIEVKGKGNYGASETINYTILKKDLSELALDDMYAIIDKNGKVKAPKITLKNGGKKLKEGTDYTVTITPEYKDADGKAIAGNYQIKIEACKDTTDKVCNYQGTKTVNFDVLANNFPVMSKAKISADPKTVSFDDITSGKYNPAVTVTIAGKTYTQGEDFVVKYPEASEINAGKVAITIEGVKGKIHGSKSYNIKVEGVKLGKNIAVSGIDTQKGYAYTGSPVELPELTLKDGDYTLIKEKDYTVTYNKNTNAGTAKVIISGKGKYTGKLTKSFKINKVELTDAAVKVDCDDTAVYTKNGAKPGFTLTYNGMTLVEKKDFTVTYKNNKQVGNKATLIIKGKGNYKNKIEKVVDVEYTVTVPDSATIKASVPHVYKSNNMTVSKLEKAVKVKLTESSTGKSLKAKTDYLKDFELFNKDGKALTDEDLVIGEPIFVKVTLTGNYAEEGKAAPIVETSFKLYDKKASNVFEIGEIDPQTYTGKAVEPKVVVKLKGTDTVLVEGIDYSVSYSKNINKGKAKVTVTGIGNGYGGTKTATFNIIVADMDWADDSVVTSEIGKFISDMFN